ncbi:hypothetical protein BH11BAC1_BH11BAC1_27880 [soil metagenome]
MEIRVIRSIIYPISRSLMLGLSLKNDKLNVLQRIKEFSLKCAVKNEVKGRGSFLTS